MLLNRALITIVAAAILSGPCSSVLGQDLRITGPGNGKLVGNSFYLISYRCSPVEGAASDNQFSLPGFEPPPDFGSFFNLDARSTSHGFMLTKHSPMEALTENNLSNFTNGIGGELVYVKDETQPIHSFDNRKCQGKFIVKGSDEPTLSTFVITTKKAQTEGLQASLGFITSAAGPLANLLTGNPLAAEVTTRLTSLDNLGTKFKDLVEAFDGTLGSTKAQKLFPGSYTVTAPDSRITFSVEAIGNKSLLLGPAPFKAGVTTLIGSNTLVTIATSDLEKEDADGIPKCRGIASGWAIAGVGHPVDRAYVLWRSIAALGPTKQQLVRCFGRTLATEVQPYLAKLDIPADSIYRYSAVEVSDLLTADPSLNSVFGLQPKGSRLPSTSSTLAEGLWRLTSVGEMFDDDLEVFVGEFQSEVILKDSTRDYHIAKALSEKRLIEPKKSSMKGDIATIAAHLRSLGVATLNCPILTSANTALRSRDNEAIVIPALQTTVVDGQNVAVAHGLRILFDDTGLVRQITITNDVAVEKFATACPELAPPAKVVQASAPA